MPAFGVAGAVAVVMLAFISRDPVDGVTFSNSPFTDEAWWSINARNLVLLGDAAIGDWQLHLLTVPYFLMQSAVLSLLGVGIAESRLVTVAAVALTALVLAMGLRSPLGRGPALLSAVGYTFSLLVLYYGRLAYPEPVVALFMAGLIVAAARSVGPHAARWGLVAGLMLGLAAATKANGLPAAAGCVAAVAAWGWMSQPTVRRWAVAAVGAAGMIGLAWLAAVVVPNADGLAQAFVIINSPELPTSIGEAWLRTRGYLRDNDQALLHAAPLVTGGVAGVVLAAIRWRHMSPQQKALVLGAVGAVVVGLGLLVLVEYRPNRYVVPILPALAVLMAVGAASLRQSLLRWTGSPLAWRLAVVVIAAALVAPGLLAYGRWMTTAGERMPEIQRRVAEVVDAPVEGRYAPLFAMSAPVPAYVQRWGAVNSGDSYLERGVRWLVLENHEREPRWVHFHPDVWRQREAVLCEDWGRETVCLIRLP
jgi:hypothetical protein